MFYKTMLCVNIMKKLPLDATDSQLLDLVHSWVDALAKEDYEFAYHITAHDRYYQWTPKLIEKVIQGYGLPEPRSDGLVFQVTEIESASGNQPRHYVEFFDEPIKIDGSNQKAVGEIWFDLPLNGKWSDLTATFEIRQDHTATVLVLNEVHVF